MKKSIAYFKNQTDTGEISMLKKHKRFAILPTFWQILSRQVQC